MMLTMHTTITRVIKPPACTLFASTDAYNSVVNAYYAHDAASGS